MWVRKAHKVAVGMWGTLDRKARKAMLVTPAFKEMLVTPAPPARQDLRDPKVTQPGPQAQQELLETPDLKAHKVIKDLKEIRQAQQAQPVQVEQPDCPDPLDLKGRKVNKASLALPGHREHLVLVVQLVQQVLQAPRGLKEIRMDQVDQAGPLDHKEIKATPDLRVLQETRAGRKGLQAITGR